MLKRLRHDPVVDGDRQKRKIDPACAREHRVNEALVAGNINESDRLPRSRRHIGEAQATRDAPGLLFLWWALVSEGAKTGSLGNDTEMRQVGEERLILTHATQVKHEALLLNSSDDRSRQFAQHRRQVFQLAASPLGGDGETGASNGFERQRAGPDLAVAFAYLDREVAAERFRPVGQHAPRLPPDLIPD